MGLRNDSQMNSVTTQTSEEFVASLQGKSDAFDGALEHIYACAGDIAHKHLGVVVDTDLLAAVMIWCL